MKRTASSALTLAIASVATVAFGQNAGEALMVPGAWEDGAAVPSLTSIRLETIRSRDETLLRDLAAALVARYGTLLEGTEILFTRVETFGTVFYRLDIQNIGSEEDARRICAVLEMERCLVARPGASQLVTGEAFVIAPDGLIDMHASAQVLGEGVSNSVEFSPLPTMPQGPSQGWEEAEPLRDALGVLPLDRPSRAQAVLGDEVARNAFLPQAPADSLSDSLDAALALARSEPREATPELVLQEPEAQPQRPRPSLAPANPPAVSVSVADGAGGAVPLVRGVEDPKAVEGLIAQVARPRLAPRMRPAPEAAPAPAAPVRSAPSHLPDLDRLTRLPGLRPEMGTAASAAAPAVSEDGAAVAVASDAVDVAVEGVRPRMRPDRAAPIQEAEDHAPALVEEQDVAGLPSADGAPRDAAKPLPVWKAGPRQPQEIVPAERLVSRAPRHVAPVAGDMAQPSPRSAAAPAVADSLPMDAVIARQVADVPEQESAPFAPLQEADIAAVSGVSSPAPTPVRSSAQDGAPARLARDGGPVRPRLRPARGDAQPQAFAEVARSVPAADVAAQASTGSAPVAETPATAMASDVDRAAPAAARLAQAARERPVRVAAVQDLAREAQASLPASRADVAPREEARVARADVAQAADSRRAMAFEGARVAPAVLAGGHVHHPHVDDAPPTLAQRAMFARGLRLAQALGGDGHVQRASVPRAPGAAGAPAMVAGVEAADMARQGQENAPLAPVVTASLSANPLDAPVWLASARTQLAAGIRVAPLKTAQEEAVRLAAAGQVVGVGRAALARADAVQADVERADLVLTHPAALAPATGAQDAPLRVAAQARAGREEGVVAPQRLAASASLEQAREGVVRRARLARAQRGSVVYEGKRDSAPRMDFAAAVDVVTADVAAPPKADGSLAPRLAAATPRKGAGVVHAAAAQPARVDVAGRARLAGARPSVIDEADGAAASRFVAAAVPLRLTPSMRRDAAARVAPAWLPVAVERQVAELADPLVLTPAMRRDAVAGVAVADTAIVRAWEAPVQVAQAARTHAPQARPEQGRSARGWIAARAAQLRGVRAPRPVVGAAPVAPSAPADPVQAARLVLTAEMRAPHASRAPAVVAKAVEKHVLAETKILEDSGSVLPISPAPATVSGARVIAAHARPVETETEKMLFESALMAAIAPTAAPVAVQEVAARIEVASARPERDMAQLAKILDRARPAQESVALVGVDAPIGMEALLDSAEMTVRLISAQESVPEAAPAAQAQREPIEVAALMPARTHLRAGAGAVRDRVRLDAIPGPRSGRPIDAFLSVWGESMPLATSELALATAMPREWGATQAVYRGPAPQAEDAQPAMWAANPPAAAFHALGQTLDEVQTIEGYIEALTKPGTIFAAPQVPSFAQVAQARAESAAARAVLDSALAERGAQEADQDGPRMALPQVRPDPKALQGEEAALLPQTIRATVGADAITMETQDLRVLAPRTPKPASRFAVVFSDTYALPFDLSGTGRPPLQRLPLVRPRVAAQGEAAEPTARMIAASEDMSQFFPTEASSLGQDGQPGDRAVDMIDELRGGLDETLGALEIAMDSLPPAPEVVQEALDPVEARPALSLPPLDATVRPLAAAPLVPAEGEIVAAPVVPVVPQAPESGDVVAPAGAPTVADLLDAPAGTPAPELGPMPPNPVPFAEGTPNWPSVGSASILDRDTRRMAPASPNDALMIRLSYAASPDEVTVRVRDLMRNFPQSMLEKGRFYGAAAPASPGLFIVGIQAHNAIDREDLVAYMTNNGIPFVLPGQSAAPLLSQQ